MTRAIACLIITLLSATTAHAQDDAATPPITDADCVLQLSDLQSQLRINDTATTTVSAPDLDAVSRILTHRLLLPSGGKLAFTAGGCTHYSFSYHFTQLPDMPAVTDPAWFGYIRARTESLPYATADDREFMSRMVEALTEQSAQWTNRSEPLDGTLGDSTIALTPHPAENGFSISYDFPL